MPFLGKAVLGKLLPAALPAALPSDEVVERKARLHEAPRMTMLGPIAAQQRKAREPSRPGAELPEQMPGNADAAA